MAALLLSLIRLEAALAASFLAGSSRTGIGGKPMYSGPVQGACVVICQDRSNNFASMSACHERRCRSLAKLYFLYTIKSPDQLRLRLKQKKAASAVLSGDYFDAA
jgi:hypothetical protein